MGVSPWKGNHLAWNKLPKNFRPKREFDAIDAAAEREGNALRTARVEQTIRRPVGKSVRRQWDGMDRAAHRLDVRIQNRYMEKS